MSSCLDCHHYPYCMFSLSTVLFQLQNWSILTAKACLPTLQISMPSSNDHTNHALAEIVGLVSPPQLTQVSLPHVGGVESQVLASGLIIKHTTLFKHSHAYNFDLQFQWVKTGGIKPPEAKAIILLKHTHAFILIQYLHLLALASLWPPLAWLCFYPTQR